MEVTFATVGREGREYLTRRGGTVVKDFPRYYDGLDMAKAKKISESLVRRFEKGEVDAVYLVYNEFKSAMTQLPKFEQLLPPPEPAEEKKPKEGAFVQTFGFEPKEHSVLERLVPVYVEVSVFRALLETRAGFFGAQMTAMDSATPQREGHDRAPLARLQPGPRGRDHEGADGDHRRRRGAEGLTPLRELVS